MRSILALAPALTGIFLTVATVQAENNEFVVVGFGATPCAEILNSYRKQPSVASLLLFSYVEGFWSGQNSMLMQAAPSVVKNLAGDKQQILKALMVECERRPTEDFGIVVRDRFFQLPTIGKAG